MIRFVLRLMLIVGMLPSFMFGPLGQEAPVLRTRRWCRRLCRLLAIQPQVYGPLSDIRRGLLVMNHLSWVDPVIIAALLPSVFITSTEVERDPLLGRVCRRAGCLFVNRRSPRAAEAEHRLIAGLLRSRLITVFPEATSSVGETVLPFRPAFFESARLAGVPVHPVMIRYRALDERPLGPRRRDRIHWYGDMPFAPHLARLLTVLRIDVVVCVLPLVLPHCDRKRLAAQAESAIRDAYQAAAGRRSA